MTIRSGEFVTVVGRTNSGKSTLLATFLGHTVLEIGDGVHYNGKMAYVAQDPWIHGGTVRNNVVMDNEVDENWLQQVYHTCLLENDIKRFTGGDLYDVGERGMAH